MRVYLPSNGMMGLNSIELRAPKIDDLREIPNLSQSSIIRKTQFVELLAPKNDVDRITPYDRDYLFALAVAAISMNQLGFNVQCKNGHVVESFMTAENMIPVRLPNGVKPILEKKIGQTTYKFTKVNVAQETQIEEYAMALDDDKYNSGFEDGMAACTLCGHVSEDTINYVRNLDLAVYFAAIAFNYIDSHGLTMVRRVKCSACGDEMNVNLPITGEMLNVNVAQLISNFVSVSEIVDMKSFYDLTLPEWNALIASINQKRNRENLPG